MFGELVRELTALFGRGVDEPLAEDEFRRLALRVFRCQCRHNDVYASFCRRRGVEPSGVEAWQEIPPVPTRAFKRIPLVSSPTGEAEAVFRTSGTSRGPGERGEHAVPEMALYRASLLPNFRAHLLPDGARLPLISLVPHPRRAPDSSLSRMVGVVEDELTEGEGGWFVDPERGLDAPGLRSELATLEAEGSPALVVGTAFSFVHWLDAMDREGWRVRLPAGTRVMETGGFKGRSRTLTRDELYGGIEERMGIPPARIVNEYGMTELLSQFYEPHMREAARSGGGGAARAGAPGRRVGARRHVGPPWVRTRVLDPETLEPVSPGREGLLCHLDLANLGSVCRVLTEDVGVAVEDGFRVLGRVGGAEPRGCSLAMDELLAAAGSGT